MQTDMPNLTSLSAELDSLRRRLAERAPVFESHSMDFLRVLLANARGFITMLALDGTLLFVNRMRDGRSLDGAVGICVYDFLPDTQRDSLRACIDEVVRTGNPGSCESEARLGDDRRASFENHIAPIKDGEEVIALVVISTDVTARRRVDHALRRSEEKLRMAAGAAGIGFWSWDTRRDHLEWEDHGALLGFGPGSAPADRAAYLALIHLDDRQRADEVMTRGVLAGSWEDEYRMVRKDGTVRWVLAKGSVLKDHPDGSEIVLGALVDVTERRQRDERLCQAQKLEAVGQLTAGIAHNFNNLLMVVMPNLDIAMKQASADTLPNLRDAQHAALRAADLVRQLMTSAGHNRPAERRVERLDQLVARTVAICRTTFDRRITFEVSLDADASVRVDPAQVEQVFLNLLINARDALTRVEHAAPRVALDVNILCAGAPELGLAVVTETDYVRIRVADNGVGMTPETVARIYEPFFTTKGVGQGTGLGLATARTILLDHDGWISCESTLGLGTTFSVFLPCASQGVNVERTRPELAPRGGAETVLVVDDEPGIRTVVALVLESAGYKVKSAASGQEAIDVLSAARGGDQVALILLDVSMPGMPGADLRKRLRNLVPRARILYFTGYAFEATDSDDMVIDKPITEAQLLRTVREALDRAPKRHLADGSAS
jgi:two-component system cell cycle sensor histidine kinase/response regulator CckA